ncbi:winged helix-turn-helix domain-containing protein [Mycolicibacterium farcinogenes]|uniref:Winged helix-turn-helix domain-containing protein n=1 Tax=Mycolicibacterium farcinogenes TaxID=1802 RepID=A0ACD1FH77_MYCFR|nr:winged helix-turn-helix domain-containing protein [Mycolicibacterium farcinogenes]QZH66443.1 winged helix-turn-helix domain-containing protein [Mycolicibacterium farcinogenes]
MLPDPPIQTAAQKRLAAKAARQRVCECELEREIYDAAVVQGLTQRQISELVVSQSQATIQRILRRIADDPTMLDVKPAEIIDQRTAGIITTQQMMERLLGWSYSVGQVVRINEVATDSYIAGDWDSIETAFYRGQLTDDEFQRLAERQVHADAP